MTFRNIILFGMLIMFGCKEKNKEIDVSNDKLRFNLSANRLTRSILEYVSVHKEKAMIYQIFQSCDNTKIEMIVVPAISMYEIYSSPIDGYAIYKENLLIFYGPTKYVRQDRENRQIQFLNEFVNEKKDFLYKDIDSSFHYKEDGSTHLNAHRQPIKFIYYYEQDSLVSDYPYQNLVNKLIRTPKVEKTPFKMEE